MIQLNTNEFTFDEIKPEETLNGVPEHKVIRPPIVNALVYKLKSGFIKHSIYITLSYIEQNGHKRPIEIFINSKDLTKNAEYAVLTRLISAIFRKSTNPIFILEELSGIYDPNGGYHKNGKYIYSFYAEIADIIEQFFKEIGIENNDKKVISVSKNDNNGNGNGKSNSITQPIIENTTFQICPECGQKTIKMESGCLTFINPDCGYSKCDH